MISDKIGVKPLGVEMVVVPDDALTVTLSIDCVTDVVWVEVIVEVGIGDVNMEPYRVVNVEVVATCSKNLDWGEKDDSEYR